MITRIALPAHFTPFEQLWLGRLVGLLAAEPHLSKVVVFGSRARGRSHTHSDLDVAVYFTSPRDRRLERWLDEQAVSSQGVSSEEEADTPHLQVVPFFADERPSRLDAAVRREGIVLWTRN